jgi:hypothetical protein
MIFRNIVFVKYPDFYMVSTDDEHEGHHDQVHRKDPIKYWQEIALIDVIFCIAAMFMYITLSKPAFRFLYEEAFKMLLFRKPIWSKYLSINNIIEVYKYFTLLHSLLKLDFAMNIFFVLTAFYFMHCDGQVDMSYTLPFYGIFFLLTTATMVQGLTAIKTKDKKKNVRIGLLRILIEMFKIGICILVLNCYNAAFVQSDDVRKILGKIRFSILV